MMLIGSQSALAATACTSLPSSTPSVTIQGTSCTANVSVRRSPFLTAVVQCLPKGGHHHGPRQTARSTQRATLATLDPTLEQQWSHCSSFLRTPPHHTAQLLRLAA